MKPQDFPRPSAERSRFFAGLPSLRAWLIPGMAQFPCKDSKWAGGKRADAERFLTMGDASTVAKARALVDRYALAFAASMPGQPEREPALWGRSPRVPAVIAGEPLSMYRVDESEAPEGVRVFLNLYASCAILPGDLLARACAAVAFVQALALSRPVELLVGHLGNGDDGKGVFECWARAPLDDLSAIAGLAHPATYRHAFVYAQDSIMTGHANATPPGKARPRLWQPGDVLTPPCIGVPEGGWPAMYASALADSAKTLAPKSEDEDEDEDE